MVEDAGLQILGLTSDGAATNKTMFKHLGVCGSKADLKSYFANPFDSRRKVFVFCDAPHTIKNVRNRLEQKKILKVSNTQLIYLLQYKIKHLNYFFSGTSFKGLCEMATLL